jgi:hypothetical protein
MDYLFTYAAIAENKAYIDDYKGAVEAGLRVLPLVPKYDMEDTYGSLKWDVLQWMVSAGMNHEARIHLERIIASEYGQQIWE